MFVRNVLITGANRGLGLEFVKQFIVSSEPPGNVFAACRSPEDDNAKELQQLASQNPTVKVLQLDVTDEATIVKAADGVCKTVGEDGLNLLINNAGVTVKRVAFDNVPAEDVTRVLATNSAGPLLVTKSLLPLLKKAAIKDPGPGMSCSRAAIVNISSELGSIEPQAAVNMLTKSMSCGLRDNNILAIALHPGWVLTGIGGPRAPLSTEESVKGMLKVLAAVNEINTGQFLDYLGKSLPW